jgi:hypothetical protein
MKRVTIALAVLALFALTAAGIADDGHKHDSKAATKAESKSPQSMVLTGEVVDTGCYLGHGARGEKHAACAAKCISGGMPMGLLTKENRLYLLTLNHDNADPYNSLKGMAGKTVSVKGTVAEKDGLKAIDVAEVQAAPADASSAPSTPSGK